MGYLAVADRVSHITDYDVIPCLADVVLLTTSMVGSEYVIDWNDGLTLSTESVEYDYSTSELEFEFEVINDDAGNLIEDTDPDNKDTTFTHDDAGRITSITDRNGLKRTFTYAAAGRVTDITHTADYSPLADYDFTWNDGGRLTQEVSDDGDGQESSTERWTAYDGANPYADFDGSENLQEQYLFGPTVDMILARMDSSQDVDWYLTDHLGTVRDIADADGTILDHIEYDSFGNVLSETDSSEGEQSALLPQQPQGWSRTVCCRSQSLLPRGRRSLPTSSKI